MKRILGLVLILTFVFTLAACSEDESSGELEARVVALEDENEKMRDEVANVQDFLEEYDLENMQWYMEDNWDEILENQDNIEMLVDINQIVTVDLSNNGYLSESAVQDIIEILEGATDDSSSSTSLGTE